MININKICACIVLFNPNIERLLENISSVVKQVDCVFLINNGSDNLNEITLICNKDNKLKLIDLKENKGIAYALNCACLKAIEFGYEYILTLDQDSVCMDDLISNYITYLKPEIGQIGCVIKDRNEMKVNNIDNVSEVDWMITSGSLVNLMVWKKIGGYDDELFIDLVDTDFGLTIIENGYKNIIIPYVGLLHEIGHISKNIKIFGKSHPVYNHSSFRRYYICRNSIIVAKKHKKLNVYKSYLKVIGRIIFIFIFEKEKFKKLKAGLKGLKAGSKYRARKV